MRAPHLLLLCIGALNASAGAFANDSPAATLLKRQQATEVSCQPTLPHFCENMHVRCSGRTSVATFAFKLRTKAGTSTVDLLTTSEEFQQRYANANVEWDKDGGYVLLTPQAAKGYVKLLADGNYVFRHYINGAGVMSLGHCM